MFTNSKPFGSAPTFGSGSTAFGPSTPSTGSFCGTNIPSSGTNVFGQPSSAFGQLSSAFAQPVSTSWGSFGFGPTSPAGLLSTNTQPTQSSSLFGNTPTPTFGSFSSTTTTERQNTGSGLFGTSNGFSFSATPNGTNIKFNPCISYDVVMKDGVSSNVFMRHQCITGMKEYENKSLEELRMEDYAANRKGPQTSKSVFGTTGQTGLFGQSAASTNFSFGTTTQSKPVFGTTPSTNFCAAPEGTATRFKPPAGTDTMMKWVPTDVRVKYHCITCMKAYENKSLEELRLDDYVANRKGPQVNVSGFGVSGQTGLFGGQSAASTASSFNSTTQSKPFFCTTQTTGFSATPNGTSIKFNPPVGSDTMVKAGVTMAVNTQHQCITCMKEYQNKSLEELRMEDYEANRKTSMWGFGSTGQTGSFGQPRASAFSFSSSVQSEPLFGTTQNSGFIVTPNGTTTKFNPSTGIETTMKTDTSTDVNTQHQCITCMRGYENRSLEELRVEDYAANRKFPPKSVSSFGTTGQPTASTFAVSFGSTTQSRPNFGATGPSKVLAFSVTLWY